MRAGSRSAATGGATRPFLIGHWRALAGAAVASIFVTVAELAKPWPIALVIDELLMRGRTTILITHSHELWATADRVIELDAGRVVRDGRPTEPRERPALDSRAGAPSADERAAVAG